MATQTNVIANLNGSVGIGTTNPTYRLDVRGGQTYLTNGVSNGQGQALIVAGSGDVQLADGASLFFGNYSYGSSTYIRGYDDSDIMYFYSNGTNIMNVRSTGVGIGTANPTAKLHVVGGVRATSFTGSFSGSIAGSNMFQQGGNSFGTTATLGTNDNQALIVETNASERMRILSGGSIGIGTSSPTQLLDVRGNIKLGADNSGNYVYYVTDIERTVVRTTRSDVSQEGLLRSDGWGNFTFNKSIGVGYSLGSGPLTGNIYAAGSIGIGTTTPNRQITIGSSNQDAIQIRRLTTSQGNSSLGTGISWTWTSATTDDETWAAIRVIMPGNGNSNMTFSTTPVSGGGSGLAERMRITDTGNVGIGSSSPGYKLDVVGDINFSSTLKYGGTSVIYGSSSDVYGNFRVLSSQSSNNDGMYIGYNSTGTTGAHIRFYANATNERMRIDANSGNVGIGTSSPAARLDVVSGSMRIASGAYAGEINFGTAAGDSTNIYLKRDNNYDLSLVQNASSGNALYLASAGNVYVSIDSNNNGTTDAFIVQNNGVKSGTELFRVQESGNVGIGSSSPSAKLDVVDSGNFFVSRDANGYPRFTTTNGSAQLGLFRTGTSAGGFYIGGDDTLFSVWTTGFSRLFNINNSGNVGIGVATPITKLDIASTQADGITFRYDTTTNYRAWIRPYWNSTADSRIDFAINRSSGATPDVIMSVGYGTNVGIGTTTPTQKLQVNGSAYITGISYSDYFYPVSGGTYNELNSPDTALNAIHKGQSHNYDLFQFNAPNTYETQATNGGAWTSVSVPTGIFAGDTTISGGSLTIANGVYAVRFTWNSVGYRFFNLLYFMQSTAGNSFTATIEHSANGSTWTNVATTGGIGGWPAHSRYMNYWNNSSTQTYLRITLTPSWSNANSIVIYNMRYFCSYYLDGASKLYTWEYDKTFNFSGKTVNLGTSAAYTAAGRSNLELYNSTDSLIALRNPSGNSYIQKTGNDFYINNVTSGNFIVQNSNTERLRINSNGSVGIGASSPQTLLQVGGETSINYTNAILTMQGGTGYGFIRMYGNSSAVEMQIDAHSSNSNAGTVGTFTNHPVYIKTNNTNKVTILADGNVGIGFTSPQRPLEVISPSNNYVSVGVLGLGVGSWCGIHFGYRENNNNYRKSAIVFERTDLTTSDAQGKIHILNGPQGSSGNATLSDAKLTINEYGNVGIGTTAPAYKLDVNGNFAASGGSAFGNTYPQLTLNGTTNQHTYLMINRTNYEAGIQFQTSGTTKWWMYMPSGTDASLRVYTNQNSSGDILTITNTGNVGINTTSPNRKLEVKGVDDATITAIFQSTAGGNAGYYGGIQLGNGSSNQNSQIYHDASGDNTLTFISNYASGTGNKFVFAPGGTERVRFQQNGNVGIGTTSPASKLHVNQTGTAGQFDNITLFRGGPDSNDSGAEVFIGQSGNSRGLMIRAGRGTSDQALAHFYLNKSGGTIPSTTDHIMTFLQGGSVGIGTTSPVYRLDVNGYIASGGSPIAWYSGNYNRIFEPAGNPALYLGNNSDPANYYDNTTHFFRNRGGSSNYAIIEGNGNLGIGTSSVTEAIHVYRAANAIIRLQAGGGNVSGVRMDDGSSAGYLLKNRSSDVTNNALAGALYTYTDNNKAFQHIHNGTPLFTILSGGNVGIGTSGPTEKLQVLGGIKIGNKLYEVPIDTLSASGTQAQRFEIARVFIDYNDWNQTGPVEIEVRENYYSDGFFKRYVFSYGYNSSNVGRLFLVESNGSSSTDCRVVVGSAVQTSGDIYYVPIYVELDYYARADVLVRTNRDRTTNASSTSGGVIYINSGPTGTNISSFDSDEVTYVSAYASKTLLGNSGCVGIGTIPTAKLDVDGNIYVRSGNGLYSNILGPYTGDLTFYTGGTEKMRILSSGGSVGIGLTSPTEKLHVSGNLKTTGTITNDGGIYYGGGSNLDINQYNNGYMRFLTNNNEKVRIDANGNVGIGTTGPIYKLDNYNDNIRYTLRCSEKTLAVSFPNGVANQKVDITFDVAPGSYVFWGNFEVEITDGYNNQLSTGQLIKVFAVGMNPATGAGPYGSALFDNTSYYKAAYGAVTINYAIDGIFFNTTTGKYYFTIIHRTSTGNTPIIKIRGFGYDQNASNNIINLTAGSVYTTNTTTYYQPAVEMPAGRVGYNGNINQPSNDFLVSGNVGVGTSSPANKLHVYDTAVETVARFRGVGDTTIIIGNTDTSGEQYITYLNQTTAGNSWMVGMDDGEDFRFAYGTTGEITDGNTKVKIGQDGNVGIGTTSPTQKLQVSGNARIDGIAALGIAQSNWASGVYGVEMGGVGNALWSNGTSYIELNNNGYFDSVGWKYANTAAASRYELGIGAHYWFTAAAGSAGTALTWSEKMRLNNAGNLGIGTTNPGGKLEIIVSGASDYLRINDTTGVFLDVGRNFITSRGANLTINCQEGAFNLQTAGTTRINVENSTGNVGIGTTSPSTKLDVVGNYMSFGPTTTAARRRQTIAGEITVAGNNTTTKMFTCGTFGTGTISIIAFVTDPSNCATALFSFCHNNPSSGGVGAQTTNRLSFTASVNGVITQIYLDMGNSNPSTQYNVTVTYTGATAPTVIFSAEGHGSQIWAL